MYLYRLGLADKRDGPSTAQWGARVPPLSPRCYPIWSKSTDSPGYPPLR